MNTDSIHILYEDNEVIVCVKPAGTAVQSRQIGRPDMVSFLKNYLCRQNSHSGSEPYLGVIHRLDQPVSGILVFAKIPSAAGSLSRQLQDGGFGKYYRALTVNPPSAPQASLKNYLRKDGRTNSSSVCTEHTPGAKPARLSYRTVSCPERFYTDTYGTELEIHLDTGRHHQIRVQLAHIGCPIAGDRKYNAAWCSEHPGTPLKLCAYRLDFCHPKTGKQMHFSLL